MEAKIFTVQEVPPNKT